MSGDTRVKQVWMPTLGVWAAVKSSQDASGSAQASQRASSDLQEGRHRRKRRHGAREEGSTESLAASKPVSHHEQPEQQRHDHYNQEQQQQHTNQEQRHGPHQKQQGYTGFQLQEQPSDGEPSDDEVVEVEPPPHCSICKRSLLACSVLAFLLRGHLQQLACRCLRCHELLVGPFYGAVNC